MCIQGARLTYVRPESPQFHTLKMSGRLLKKGDEKIGLTWTDRTWVVV